MNIEIGKKALITCSAFFVAPNGKEYRSVFGTVKGIFTAEATLGIKPNGRSTNWYLEIGNMTIAGCQINYATATDECMLGEVEAWTSTDKGECFVFKRPSVVYNADDQTNIRKCDKCGNTLPNHNSGCPSGVLGIIFGELVSMQDATIPEKETNNG